MQPKSGEAKHSGTTMGEKICQIKRALLRSGSDRLWLDQFPAMGLECRERARLIHAHEEAVPDDIRSKNSGEAALQGCSPSDGSLAEDQVRIYM